MTTTDIAVRPQGQLTAKIAYARELANSGMLPASYRQRPANVLWAVEYGDMLGIAPMAAMTGVHVIEGKPTASAGLISALVRRAGHKLRVRGDSKSATCQIIRSDDPDYTFEVTWTLRKNADENPSAEEAGLLGKAVWKNYPASMLKSRVITQCARDACEEALFGLHYTAEELGAENVDEDGAVIGEVVGEPASGQEGQPHGSGPATPEDDPWYVHPGAARDAEWLADARAKGFTLPDKAAGSALWKETAEKSRAGAITPDEATALGDLIKARVADLEKDAAEVVEGTVIDTGGLDPDHPWAEKVASIADRDDVEAALADIRQQMKTGAVKDAWGKQVIEAIARREQNLTVAA